MDFERWFKDKTSRFERLLMYSAAICLVLLFVSQIALTQPGLRQVLSLTDRLEGKPYLAVEPEQPAVTSPGAVGGVQYVELSIVSDGKIGDMRVLVNSEAVAVFGSEKTVKIQVHDGDVVEIDGDQVQDVIAVEVSAVSAGVVWPQQGKKVMYFGRPETVSWVVLE